MRAKIEALTRYEHLAKDDPYRYGYERCKADVLALLGEGTEVNPCASIFDHQWLDPKCVECGCQSLVLQALPSPATGGEAVTEEWLRSIGFQDNDGDEEYLWHNAGIRGHFDIQVSRGNWIIVDEENEIVLPTPANQVEALNLLAALGVPQPTGE